MDSLPSIDITESCYMEVDAFDLGRFIARVYGVQPEYSWGGVPEVNVVAMEEWNNDESHTYRIQKEKLDKWDRERMRKFMENPHLATYSLPMILTDLCNNGYIKEGDLLINVSW